MIVDCHIHLSSPGCRFNREDVESCLGLADRAGIDHMVYLFNLQDSGGYDPAPDDILRSNDLGMTLVQQHPDRFSSFCYLNPAHNEGFLLDEIERCIAQGPCAGIKLWVSVKADDTRLDPIMERAAALHIPILHHAWYKATGYALNESTPAEVSTLAGRHLDVPIIMAHLGGGGWRGVLDVKEYPNVLVDTSGAQPQAGLVEYAVEQLGAERVVFGSDWPIRDFAVQRARIDGANLTDHQKIVILGENMAHLLARKSKWPC